MLDLSSNNLSGHIPVKLCDGALHNSLAELYLQSNVFTHPHASQATPLNPPPQRSDLELHKAKTSSLGSSEALSAIRAWGFEAELGRDGDEKRAMKRKRRETALKRRGRER